MIVTEISRSPGLGHQTRGLLGGSWWEAAAWHTAWLCHSRCTLGFRVSTPTTLERELRLKPSRILPLHTHI